MCVGVGVDGQEQETLTEKAVCCGGMPPNLFFLYFLKRKVTWLCRKAVTTALFFLLAGGVRIYTYGCLDPTYYNNPVTGGYIICCVVWWWAWTDRQAELTVCAQETWQFMCEESGELGRRVCVPVWHASVSLLLSLGEGKAAFQQPIQTCGLCQRRRKSLPTMGRLPVSLPTPLLAQCSLANLCSVCPTCPMPARHFRRRKETCVLFLLLRHVSMPWWQ